MKYIFTVLLLFTGIFLYSQEPVLQPAPGQAVPAFQPGVPAAAGEIDPSRNGSGSLGNSYTATACGLNYVTVSKRVSIRFSPAGSGTPTTMTVAGIPAGAIVQKSFLWYGGLSSSDDPAFVVNSTSYTATTIGTGGDICWSYPGSINFRGDVTSTVTGNGTYTIDLNEPDYNVNGMTLMVIYRDVFAAYSGTISINDGLIATGSGGTLSTTVTIPPPGCATSLAKCFGMVADIQNSGCTYNFNGVTGAVAWDWWNYQEASTSFAAGATSSALSFNATDCYSYVAAGVYYQTNCATPLTYTLAQSGCNACAVTETITPAGSAGPFNYTWTPAATAGNTATATGLCNGTYTVQVVDAATCKNVTGTFSVSAISATTTQTNLTCNGVCNGTATVAASGGAVPYTYSWAPSGGSAATAGSLCAGTYTCTIRDASSCSITKTVTITQPPAITATVTSTNLSCNGACNGTATVTASGGTGTLTYSWSPSGGTAAAATSLCAGTYTCTIKDANLCSITQTVNITQPAALTASTVKTNVTCNGSCNGTATVTPAGGTGAYTYTWAPSGGSGATANSLCAGTYTCTIKDANLCSVTQTVNITQPPVLTATATHTDLSCNGVCNGTATVTAAGGTGSYTYAWSPSGGTGAAATALCAGTYTCTIKDANLCSITQTATITQPAAFTATIASTNISCNSVCNGTATVTPAGGTAGYTYSWSPSGGSMAAATALCAATYTCTIKDANLCSLTQTATITQPPVLTATTTQTNVTCNALCNGTATVTAAGGTAAYTYSWAPSGGSAATASSLCTGTYTCTITDANLCSLTQTVNITQPAALTASIIHTDLSCNGVCNGTATVTPAGGTAAYTYAWAPSGGTAAAATALCAGTYTCTIKDANLCSLTQTAAITQPAALTATVAKTDLSCNGVCNGTATVTAAGGTGAYTYAWSPSGGSAAAANSLCAGTYTCTITDANGCSMTQTISITQPPVLSATISNTNISCNGVCDGTATVIPSGGTPAYTYAWAASGGSTATASSLCTGTYTCTITDAHSCSITQTATITQPAALTAAIVKTDATCNGLCDGTATVTPSGGTAVYTYSWAPSGGTGAAATGLCGGTYTCTITDAHGCSVTATTTIIQSSAMSATAVKTDLSCNSVCNGTATVTPLGGTPAYTYSWAPSGGSAATASSLCAGTYTCTISDANTCSTTQTVTITQPAALTATSSKTDLSCNGVCDGTATVIPSGGTPAYIYAWAASGGSTATAGSLCAGTYTCTITDAHSCSITQTATITQPAALTAAIVKTDATCNGLCDGTATVTPSGGTAVYTYSWAPSGGTGAAATGLCGGTYTCTVTDAHSCSTTATVTITQPAVLTATITHTDLSCNAVCNGTATVTPSGGTAGYTYSWVPSGGSAATATGLCMGTYTCSITDNHGCIVTQTATITQPAAITATITTTAVTCNAACNGTATLSATGGTGAYSYSWAPSGGTGATATGLCAGTYTCTITDANACTATQTAVITEPSPLTSTVTTVNVTCNGVCNGSATVTPSGGTAGYTYSWIPSGGTGATATGLCAGTYTCTITDANGCTLTQTATITQPPALSATLIQTNVSCNGSCDGTATFTIIGGTPGYAYSWAPSGGSGATATGLCAGTYTLTVTDANGCVLTQAVTITQSSTLAATSVQTNVSCNGVCDGTSIVTASGGTPGYTYAWLPSGGAAANATALCAGSYTCTVTDANGCTFPQSVTITQPTALSVSAAQTAVSCNGLCDGTATATVTGGTPGYSYSWAPAGGSAATATGLCAGTYTCNVTDANGCTITQIFTITQPPLLTATESHTNVTCNAACNGTASITASGGTPGYTYAWLPSGGSAATATGLCAGTYTCTITDANGCSVLQTVIITEPPVLTATVAHTNVSCNTSCDGTASITASGGTPAYTYAWLPSGGNAATAGSLCAGSYTCTITDTNACSITQIVTITEPPVLTATSTHTDVSCNAACNGTATVTASGGTAAYTYAWAPSGGSAATATGLCAGTYTCTITDANGCSVLQTVIITEPPVLTATVVHTNTSCNAFCNGTATVTPAGGTAGYTYSWAPSGGSAATATALCAGTYTCTITDAHGCSITSVVTITEPPVLSATISTTVVTCYGGTDGTATGTASGGTAPYSYAWSNGGTLVTTTGLAAGAVQLVVTDSNMCTVTANAVVTQNPAVVISVNNDSVCAGQSAVLTVSGANSYSWNTDPALSSTTGASVTATPITTTTYTVTGTTTSGCMDTAYSTVTVFALPVISVSGINTICSGSSTSLTASGAATYSWLPVTGLSSPLSATTNAAPLTTTTYTVTGTSVAGCTDSSTYAITVNATPVVTVTGDSVCRGNTAGLTAGGAASYSWYPSAGLSATTGATVTATITATTTYTVVGTDANGCRDSVPVTATILPLPVITVNSPSLCSGAQVNLNASGAQMYTWLPVSGLSSGSGATVTANPTVTSTYTVSGTDAYGCSATTTSTVTLLALPHITITGDTVACLGDVITLNAATSGGPVLWSTGESTPSITFSPAASGVYSAATSNSCGSQTDNVFVLVHPLPSANAGPDVTIGLGNSTTLHGAGGASYAWYPVSGLSCSACASPVASPEHTTEYILTTSDVNGCSFSDTVTVIVDEETTVFVPDIFSPNGDGHNDLFTVAGSGIESLDLHIYDRWGQMVFNGSGEHSVSWDGTFKGSMLNDAVFVYTLYITYADGRAETKKGNLTLKK